MKRRNFLNLGLLTALTVPISLLATDYRAEKPKAWTAHTVEDAIKALYGDISPIEKGIKLHIPKISSNGAAIPVKIKSDLALKSLSVFQDANPEAAVATYTIRKDSLVDYALKIKMAESGSITVIAEGEDGKFYSISKRLETSPGCEG